MTRNIRLAFFIAIISLYAESAAASVWANLHPSITSGFGLTTLGNGQNVWLAHTPEPGLENHYSSGGKQYGTLLLGLALEKTFPTKQKNIEPSLGLELDYIKNTSSLSGTVHPMVNVASDFDTLNYAYNLNSYLLFATAKISKLNLLPHLGAYLQAGIGGAINKLSDYRESSPDGSSASSMLASFGDRSKTQFAYSIGAGILYQFGTKSARVLFGYRYVNSGSPGFSKSPVQQTSNTLNFSALNHHFLTCTLTL